MRSQFQLTVKFTLAFVVPSDTLTYQVPCSGSVLMLALVAEKAYWFPVFTTLILELGPDDVPDISVAAP